MTPLKLERNEFLVQVVLPLPVPLRHVASVTFALYL